MPPFIASWYSNLPPGRWVYMRRSKRMRMDKLTNQLQLALADAQSLALGKDHNFIEPVHLLGALLDQQGGACRPLLQKAGADIAGDGFEAVAQGVGDDRIERPDG